MENSNELKTILLSILSVGLLRIRAFANNGVAAACSIEADHLHNIPGALLSGRKEELLYYFNIERPAFIKRANSNIEDFQPLWDQLAKMIAVQERKE